MEAMMEIAVILAILNSVVLAFLIGIYGRIARKTRAGYSIGLMIFALFLLAQNLATVLSYVMMSPFFGTEALPFLTSISALEFAGLIVLAKITF
ncbi:MAG: hypothetical protein OK457_09255 [Thaumarchaeota archaeon]|nr:hypothetical protein [Nitrososphaerota archaeon]